MMPTSADQISALGLSGSLGSSGGRDFCYAFSDATGGGDTPQASSSHYDGCNLDPHHGDDPHQVAGNRAHIAARLGLRPDQVVYMKQIHSANVGLVRRFQQWPSDVPDCDALVTTDSQLGLAVLVADCVPVLAADPQAGVIAAIHAGRRGVETGVVPAALERMVRLGAEISRILVRLGPAICGCCYEVPQQLAEQVLAVAPQAHATTPSGTPGLDLRQGLVGVLTQLGVRDVELVGPCTRETPQLYSYRRAQTQGHETGRQAGIVWSQPVPDDS